MFWLSFSENTVGPRKVSEEHEPLDPDPNEKKEVLDPEPNVNNKTTHSLKLQLGYDNINCLSSSDLNIYLKIHTVMTTRIVLRNVSMIALAVYSDIYLYKTLSLGI